ncbi:MAG: pilus assembly protein PilM [bacterium]
MFKNSHKNFFPVPSFLSGPSFGLDISEESIKFTELISHKDGIMLGRYGERDVPAGVIESGKIKNLKKLEEILTSLKKEEKIKSVLVSLPEEQIYLFRIKLEKDGLENIRQSIEFSLEEHIPIPAQDVVFDYEILNEDAKSLNVQVAVIPSNIIEDYVLVFENSGIDVFLFELEAQAIVRAIIRREDPDTYMVVDFGKKRTGISIVSNGILMFTSTVDMGGVILTNVIEKSFKINFEEAEKMKQKYGLSRDSENREIFSVLLNGVSVLRDEILKHFLFWHTNKEEGGKEHPPIKKIILCGGDSNLIGLTEYLSVSMKTKVEVANVWVNISDVEKEIPQMSKEQSLSYATAIGLALGNFEK